MTDDLSSSTTPAAAVDAASANAASASAAAAALTALALITLYAVDRSRAAIFSPGPNPALVMASAKIEYFWRLSLCGWLAVPLFVGLRQLVRGREAAAVALARRLVAPVAVGALLLAVFFP